MRILYIGAKSGTSLQRATALKRLGARLHHNDVDAGLPHRWQSWLRHCGGVGIDRYVAMDLRRSLFGQARTDRFDLVHIDSGEVIGPQSIALLKTLAPRLSHYTGDNPYADPRPEKRRWDLFLRALPNYDLAVTVSRPGVHQQMLTLGARAPLVVTHCADEVIHQPSVIFDPKWQADVAFVGTWMPGRGAFLAQLAAAGIKLAIYGPRWQKSRCFNQLSPYLRGGYLEGADYAAAIASARIALVLLNDANNDTHTSRSIEVPALGTLLCAPRTEKHQSLYQEGLEALFYETLADCAQLCRKALSQPDRLFVMAQAGRKRAKVNGHFNEALMQRIIDQAMRAQGDAA